MKKVIIYFTCFCYPMISSAAEFVNNPIQELLRQEYLDE